MPLDGRRNRIRLPADTVLTGKVLLGAARKLSDAELADLIQALVDELGRRAPDPDREPDPEDNSDPFAIKAARTGAQPVFCSRSRPEG